MKVLMMVCQFPPAPTGGAERQCWKQARALAAQGHQVTIITRWLVEGSLRQETKDGVQIWRLGLYFPMMAARRRAMRWWVGFWKGSSEGSPARSGGDVATTPTRKTPLRKRWEAFSEWMAKASFLLEVAWMAKTRRLSVDVVHVHVAEWLAGFAQWVGECLGVPVFCKEALLPIAMSLPEADAHVPWAATWLKYRVKCRFIAITEAIAEALVAAGIPEQRIVRIPNGVELPDQRADPARQADALYIGNFTQGAAHKGFDVLLQAWGQALQAEPAMRLHLFGAGDTTPWQVYAHEQGCGESVIFEGRTEQVWSAHRRSGFLVLPSRKEGLSNSLLEAMASGLPSVVSDIPGNVAAVRDGVEGLVVPVGDVAALAAAMVKLYRSAELRARMGTAARERATACFSIEHITQQLEEAYRRAITEDRAGRT